ncbi:MAG: hypothetical protein WBM41_02180 [Arenicellales bacterium]
MTSNHRKHALIQSHRQVEKLNSQVELKRAQYLLDEALGKTGRTLRKAKNIKFEDETLNKKIAKQCKRLNLMHDTLEVLYSEAENIPLSKRPVTMRRYMKKVG